MPSFFEQRLIEASENGAVPIDYKHYLTRLENSYLPDCWVAATNAGDAAMFEHLYALHLVRKATEPLWKDSLFRGVTVRYMWNKQVYF